jgi:flagellar motor switch protein FliM
MDFEMNTPGPRPVPPAAEYQACAPGALPSGQMAFVRAIQEKFLCAFAEELAHRLETPVAAQCAAVQPLSTGAFLESADDGGCLLTLDAEPVRGQALVALSAGLVAYLLRVLLGAPASPDGPRPVTEIELHILREIFELLTRELSAAWKPAGTGFRWTATGTRDAAGGQGTLLVFDCRLDLEGGVETFRIAVPAFLARLAALASAPATAAEAPAPVREMILQALRRSTVSVEAVLAGSTLRMGDLLSMEPGHVLMLAQPAGSPLECRINGKAKLRGEWITRGDRQALELL